MYIYMYVFMYVFKKVLSYIFEKMPITFTNFESIKQLINVQIKNANSFCLIFITVTVYVCIYEGYVFVMNMLLYMCV